MTTASISTANIPAIQPDQMAIPREELSGVVIALLTQDSEAMMEWTVQAIYDTELEIDRHGEDAPDELHQDMTTLMLTAQAATSAAAAALIYKDPYHCIFLEKSAAVQIVRIMARYQTLPTREALYRQFAYQVDQAFVKNNEFANVPEN